MNLTEQELHPNTAYSLKDISPDCEYSYSTLGGPNSVAVRDYGYAREKSDYWNPRLPGYLELCTVNSDSVYAESDWLWVGK